MKKIGIVVCYHIRNYGSVLQSYATQRIIDKMGLENDCINYKRKFSIHQFFINLTRLGNKELVKGKINGLKIKLYSKLKKNEQSQYIYDKNKKFEEFIQKNFHLSKEYRGYKELEKSYQDFNIFLLGSDQVWNPVNLGNRYYSFDFVPDSTYKIAYAPSFGVSQIPAKHRKATAAFLERFDKISVREESGKEIIKELIGKDVPVVVDPTLLFQGKDWDEVVVPKMIQEDYIFCYFLGNSKEKREMVKELKRKTNLKIVALPFLDEIIQEDIEMSDYNNILAGPSEFISLIKHAKYICTDSFHGTVFSIIYQKQFLAFRRYMSNDKGSTNGRIDSLLGHLGLTERIINSKVDDLDRRMEEKIDYGKVNQKLNQLRQESLGYLKDALDSYEVENENDD